MICKRCKAVYKDKCPNYKSHNKHTSITIGKKVVLSSINDKLNKAIEKWTKTSSL